MKLTRYEKPSRNVPQTQSAISDIDKLFQWFNDPFEMFLGRRFAEERVPMTQFNEDKDNFYITVELPGIKKDDVSLECDNSVISITAKSKQHNKSENEESESSYSFSRSVRLPDSVNAESITASLEDGLLTIKLPKSESKKRHQIQIQ